jgi:GR25 family glycosyltransferase involved in LPS biosynthesis
MSKNTTIVTGIWDLKRAELSEGWGRNFDHYLNHFKNLLAIQDINLAIFIDPEHEDFVWQHRKKDNTVVYHHTKDQFSGGFFPFFDRVQKIRTNPQWLNQVGWLSESTQAKLEWYNPVVMSKMFLLHNTKVFNPFNSDYYFWLDGGITNTVHPGYFSHDKILEKIESFVNKMLFVCFPYETDTEIHGFDINAMKKYAQSPSVNRVARGGFFGGHKDYISQANDLYYSLLNDTLSSGYMGTEESIFTIMTYLDPDTYQFESINQDGLLATFFENVKNNATATQIKRKTKLHKNNNTTLYINTFNSPDQLQMVLDSFDLFDKNFLDKTEKVLINNSTKEELFADYDRISQQYNFREIRKGNMGICRARQYAAEEFAKSGNKYMLFFEDDMLLDFHASSCPFGFNKKVRELYNTVHKIMDIEEYDFLKFSFSEFYGHNGEQWSWHNVPMDKKLEYFGDINKKPYTKFTTIKSLNGTPYAEGEVYYSNWPHIISQEGNKKCFLDTKWAAPFEQTWMSHIYTLTKEEKVKPAILLASPITHNRVHHYDGNDRKEN